MGTILKRGENLLPITRGKGDFREELRGRGGGGAPKIKNQEPNRESRHQTTGCQGGGRVVRTVAKGGKKKKALL